MSDIYLNNIKNTTHRKERNSLTKNELEDLTSNNEDYDSDKEISIQINGPAPVFKLLPNIQSHNENVFNLN